MQLQRQHQKPGGRVSVAALFKGLAMVCLFLSFPFILRAQQDNPLPVSETDSVSAKPARFNIEERLKDPDFDVRLPNGARLRPWHDRNSMYPRRTLPLSQMACLGRESLHLWG